MIWLRTAVRATGATGFVSILSRIFARDSGRSAMVPLYNAVVEEARDPAWYLQGGVADTMDGRFDMVAGLLSLALIRLESEGADGAAPSALLAEIFVDDMDGQLRQDGIGDIVVGKHIGRMMAALGGRIGAYRAAFDGEGTLEEALQRNLYRGDEPAAADMAFAAARMRAIRDALDAQGLKSLLAGAFPTP